MIPMSEKENVIRQECTEVITSNDQIDQTFLSWKELEIKKWRGKAIECKCRTGLDFRLCRLIEDVCCYANCPFKYWR